MAPLFLRLISWKSHPQSIQILVKLDFFTNFLIVSFVLIYSCLLWSWAESAVSPAGKKCYFGFDSGKFFLIEWGWVFHDVNLKNNGAIVIPRFSTTCGWVRNDFGSTHETFTVRKEMRVPLQKKAKSLLSKYIYCASKCGSSMGISPTLLSLLSPLSPRYICWPDSMLAKENRFVLKDRKSQK